MFHMKSQESCKHKNKQCKTLTLVLIITTAAIVVPPTKLTCIDHLKRTTNH